MPKVNFIQHDGERSEVEVPVGISVMEGAVQNGVPGIDADCGGQCACATCHVVVALDWRNRVGPVNEQEGDMLDLVEDRQEGSRLSCQIEMREEFDGLEVVLPENQY